MRGEIVCYEHKFCLSISKGGDGLNLNGIRRKEANIGYHIRQGCVRMVLRV